MLLALIVLFAPSTSAVETARAALIARSVYAAEDAAAKHDWTTVKSVLEPVVDDATINGRMWQLLGRAYFATGDWTRARRAYERVFELRQGTVSSAAYSIAVCSARLGDNAGAMAWLERAVATSLRSMDDARSEEAFKPLRSDKRFRQLFSVVDPKSLSRVQGWSLDLDVLSREIKRKAFHPFVTRRRDRVEWGAQLTEKQFDRAVADLKSRVGRLSDQRMGLEIQRLLRRVGDGHTASFADEGPAALRWTLPMLTFDFEEGLYVVAAKPPYDGIIGWKLTHVDGKPVAEIRRHLDDFISRDNAIWPRQVLPYLLRNTSMLHALGIAKNEKEASLTFVDSGGHEQRLPMKASTEDGDIWNTLPAPASWTTIQARLGERAPRAYRRIGDYYWFEIIPDTKTLYFQYNHVINDPHGPTLEQFARTLEEFINAHDVDRVIVDLRWNNGGNTFLNEPLLHVFIRNAKLNSPGHMAVIIGRRTFSAAMNASSYLERHLRPIFIGEPTGGKPNAPGDEVFATLPYSGIAYNVSDVLWQGGWPYDARPWIAPQIATPPRFEDLAAGRDPALDAALAIH